MVQWGAMVYLAGLFKQKNNLCHVLQLRLVFGPKLVWGVELGPIWDCKKIF